MFIQRVCFKVGLRNVTSREIHPEYERCKDLVFPVFSYSYSSESLCS